MGKDNGGKTKKSLFGGVRHSLRAQIGLIVLLSYLLPVILLGSFAGRSLLNELEAKTRSAITAGAEQAWTLTGQNVERALELARDAILRGMNSGK